MSTHFLRRSENLPAIREKHTKSGVLFYEIGVSRGRGIPKAYMTFYPHEGWSARTTQRELNKAARDFEKEVQSGAAVPRKERKALEIERQREAAKVQTLFEYGEKVFMPNKTVTFSENSRTCYQQCLNSRIYPAIGNLKMPDITPANISALLLSIQSDGKAHSTVIKYYTVLHSLFKMAYLDDTITRNPMDKVERPKPRKGEIRGAAVDAFTVEEIVHIKDYLSNEPLKWQALVSLLIDTGMRRGECCALRWSDVNFADGTITVEKNLCYTPQKGVYLDTPKNGKSRVIDVCPEVMQKLQLLRKEQINNCILSEFVFTQENSGAVMHPQTPTEYLKDFGNRYGIANLHPHKLRHSFASIAITNGADIASVSEKLGHSDKAVTLRMYTHADKESIKRAGDIFRAALNEKRA